MDELLSQITFPLLIVIVFQRPSNIKTESVSEIPPKVICSNCYFEMGANSITSKNDRPSEENIG